MPTIPLSTYLNPAVAPGILSPDDRVMMTVDGRNRTVDLGAITTYLAPLIAPMVQPLVQPHVVANQSALDAAILANPNRIIVLVVNGIVEKAWMNGGLLTPAINTTPVEPIIQPPSIVDQPSISPTAGGVGSSYRVTRGTYFGPAPITVTGTLMLGATNVTAQMTGDTWISTGTGTVTWSETATNAGGTTASVSTTATVSSAVYPQSTARAINGISFTFATAAGGECGTMEDNETIAMTGGGGASGTATGVFATVVGQTYTLSFDIDGYNSVYIGPATGTAYYTWAGLSTGHYDRTFVATTTSARVIFTRANAGRGFVRNVIVPTLNITGMAPRRMTEPSLSPWQGGLGDTFTVTRGTYYGQQPINLNGRLMRDAVDVTSQMTGDNYVGDTLTSNLRWIEEPTNGAGSGPTFTTASASVVGDATNVLPTGYKSFMPDGNIDKSLTYNWSNPALNIYLANWFNGVMSTSDPSLITWHPDGRATLRGEQRSDGWYMGSIQWNKPRKVFGRCGAVIEVTQNGAVHAFFSYAENGLEIDFENTMRNGVSGWTPAYHTPKTGGGKAHSNKRTMNRAPVTVGQPQVLEYNRLADRIEFYCNGQLFETITPADMSDGYIWDTTTEMKLICSVEKHSSWAGWSNYSSAAMIVHGMLT